VPSPRDGWLVLAGVLCLVGAGLWVVASLDHHTIRLPGAFTTAVFQKNTADGEFSMFAAFWNDRMTVYSGRADAGSSLVEQLVMLLLVSLPVLVLVPTGMALMGRRRQLSTAAFLTGTAVLWIPGAYGWAVTAAATTPLDRADLAIGGAGTVAGTGAMIITAVRVLRSDTTWLCRRATHWGFAVIVVGAAAMWLVTDIESRPRAFGATLVTCAATVLVPLFGGLLGPHRIGSRVMAGWLCVLGPRAAVDVIVLANFGEYSFANGQRDRLTQVPAEFVVSVLLATAAVLVAAVLTGVLSGRSHDRAEGVMGGAR